MRIVIVGGGVIGSAVAWRAALTGDTVTVLDPAPGRAASWAAAGMLAPVTEVHYGEESLLALNLASAARWPSFAAELGAAAGIDPGYRTCGTLTVARNIDDAAALAELHAFQQRLGLPVEKLGASAMRAAEPMLSPRIRGGLAAPDDHQVDNRALTDALLVAGQRAGVTFDRRRAVAVTTRAGAVTGVTPEGGTTTLPADAVVLATGVGPDAIGGIDPGVLPPVRPVKGQLLHLRGPSSAAPGVGVIRGLEVYLVSRGDGRVVVGATVEERGSDTTVTAGAVLELLRASWELVPGIAELALVEATAGLRPATPDNAPALGPAGPEGLHVAVGHFRNGILLAPITADTLVESVHGRVPELLAPFDPRRFHHVEAAR